MGVYIQIIGFDGTNSGSNPQGSLILSGSSLYGLTKQGGAYGYGVIFQINTDGSGYTKILDFDNTNNGGNPEGSLIISGSTLYGMTEQGGAIGYGVIFQINTDGSGFSKLLDLITQ